MSQFESQFEEDLYHARQQTLQKIAVIGQRAGLSPLEATYPNHFRFFPEGIDVPKLRAQYADISAEQLEADKPQVAIAGRVVAHRLQGKAGFAQLLQGGERLQIYVRKDNVSEDTFELYKLLDLGDHIGVSGTLFRTRTGELTIQVAALSEGAQAITFLTKALLPLPDKFSGLGDIELRYRRRYLDLFTDTGDTPAEPSSRSASERPASPPPTELSSRPEAEGRSGETPVLPPHDPSPTPLDPGPWALDPVQALDPATSTRLPARSVFLKRAAILKSIRNFFDTRGYLEVETPMLHTIAGGAAARTFTTHHNAEDVDLTLRIAPELYLKRLVVGGFDRVYEINRNFRNEGTSTKHNPEFTMLEFYQAYSNYHDLMDLTEELIKTVAIDVNGTTITHFNGHEIDLGKWTKFSMLEAITKWWPQDMSERPTRETFASSVTFTNWFENWEVGTLTLENNFDGNVGLARHLQFLEFVTKLTKALKSGNMEFGKAIAEIFEYVAEPYLIQPHIIYDFPLAVSPLSKVKPDEPEWTERFEFYIGGFEVGNAFSELNDPADQLRRFEAQVADKDPESMAAVDEDYVRALGYGLPPTAGEGIGIDRLTMLLTGSRSIRDVILFPLMRPRE